MTRFNLWLTIAGSSTVVCYGRQQEMNELAAPDSQLSEFGQVHVLPDGIEPSDILSHAS
jgi:hypothetical protein